MAEHGGTILKGEDGSLYFLRDELLAACKVEGEYLERVEHMLDEESDEVEGFAFRTSIVTAQPVSYVRGSLVSEAPQLPKDFGQVASTIMCPW